MNTKKRKAPRQVWVVEDATGAPHYLRWGTGEAWVYVDRSEAEAVCEPTDRIVRYVPAKDSQRG